VPLKAIVDRETIIGPDLSKEEWTTLKSRHKKGLTITMGCCGAPGHLKNPGLTGLYQFQEKSRFG